MKIKKIIVTVLLVLGVLAISAFAAYYFNTDYLRRVAKTFIRAFGEIKDAMYQPDFEITHGPYICSMNEKGDLYVVWKTNRPAVSWVELTSDATGETVEVYETRAGRNMSSKTLHTVRLKDLSPDTRYAYHVNSIENKEFKYTFKIDYGAQVSSKDFREQPYEFKTFSDSATHSSFAVINDVHGDYPMLQQLGEDVDFKGFDFVMFNGDMVGAVINEDVLFSEYIDTSVEMFASETPIIWGRGNHETYGVYADYMLDYFPNIYNEFYYMYMVGDIAYLVIDAGEHLEDSYWDRNYGKRLARFDDYRKVQAKWLEKVIETEQFKNARFRIVFMHIAPLYEKYEEQAEQYDIFVPILQKANIDLMFSGHTHNYTYYQANDTINFPIIINGERSLLQCDVSENEIHVLINELDLDKTIEHRFARKKKEF